MDRRIWPGGLIAAVLAGACRTPPPEPTPACEALVAAARRAGACDPALLELADHVEASPDEAACRQAILAMLAPAPHDATAIVSVHEPGPNVDPDPLTRSELEAVLELPLPGTLVLVPDVPPEGSRGRNHATLDGLALVEDGKGRLHTTIRPGLRTLDLRHGATRREYCVQITACESLVVTAHGARLARHPDVRPGRCD